MTTKEGIKSFFAFFEKKSKKIVSILMIFAGVAVLTVVAAYVYAVIATPKNPEDVVATVFGKSITVKDVTTEEYSRNFVGTPDNPAEMSTDEKNAIVTDLVEREIIRQTAGQYGISVSNEEIQAEIDGRGIEFDKFSELQKTLTREDAKNTILKKKVKDTLLGWKSGTVLFYHFDKYYDTYKLGINGAGNEQLIAQQKEYAKNLAQKTYQDLVSGKVTIADAKKALDANPEIGEIATRPLSPMLSRDFTKEDYDSAIGVLDNTNYNLRSEISSVNKGGISKPFIFSNQKGDKYSDLAYAIIDVTDGQNGKVSSTYDEWMSEKASQKEVKINFFGRWPGLFNFKFAEDVFAAGSFTCAPSNSEQAAVKLYVNQKTATGSISAYNGVNLHFTNGVNGTNIHKKNSSCDTVSSGNSTGEYTTSSGYASMPIQSNDGYAYLFDCAHTSYGRVIIDSKPAIAGATSGTWYYTARSGHVGGWNNTTDTWKTLNTSLAGGNTLPFYLNYGGSANGDTTTLTIEYRPTFSNKTLNVTVDGGTGTVKIGAAAAVTIPEGSYSNGSVLSGTTITITAAVSSGYTTPATKAVVLNGGSPVVSAFSSPYTLTMTGDYDVYITFPPCPTAVSVVSSPPGASGVGGGGSFAADSEVNPWRSEYPNAGWTFSGWTGSWPEFSAQTGEIQDTQGYDGGFSPTPVNPVDPWSHFLKVQVPEPTSCPANLTITANFSQNVYSVTTYVYPAGGGTAIANPGTVTYGGLSTLTATPSSGYRFSGWTGDCSGSSNPYVLDGITNNKACTASFVPLTYTITPSADTGCSISPSTVQAVNSGGSLTLSGGSTGSSYSWNGYSIDGGAPVLQPSYTFSNVTVNHTIRAKCTPQYTLSTSAGVGGTVSPGGTYSSGATPTITATANSGYLFDSWSGDAGCSGPVSHTITMDTNKSCTANFTWTNTAPTVTLVSPVGNPTLASGTTSATLEAYSADDGNSQTMDFQLYNPSGNLVAESGWMSYVANNVHRTYPVSGLAAGTYRWRAQSFDGSLYSAWVEDYFTVDVVHDFSCSVSPQAGGTSPLVVKVVVNPINISAPYTYRMNATNALGDGNLQDQSGKSSSTLYYTYSSQGTYQVQVYNSTVGWRTCVPSTFNVSVPTSGSGGEVAR